MDIEDEGKAAWEGQLSKLLWTVNKLVNDQDRLLRKLNELSSPASTYLGENRLLTRLKTGQSLLIDGRDRGCGLSLIKEGLVERHVMKVLQRTFRKNAVFLDVGANFGFYSIMAGGQIGPRGKVYAFEANPYLGEFIKDSARINGLRLVVEIVNKAVSDQEGVAQFGFSFAGISGGSLAKGAQGNDGKLTFVDVPLVRIDDVVPKDLVVDCAKLDVEGNELAALSGMRSVIERSPDIQIAIEFFPGLLGANGQRGILDFLAEVKLNYWRIDGRGHLETAPRSQLLKGGPCYLLAARKRPNDRSIILDQDFSSHILDGRRIWIPHGTGRSNPCPRSILVFAIRRLSCARRGRDRGVARRRNRSRFGDRRDRKVGFVQTHSRRRSSSRCAVFRGCRSIDGSDVQTEI